jgi:hypothetical protein
VVCLPRKREKATVVPAHGKRQRVVIDEVREVELTDPGEASRQ